MRVSDSYRVDGTATGSVVVDLDTRFTTTAVVVNNGSGTATIRVRSKNSNALETIENNQLNLSNERTLVIDNIQLAQIEIVKTGTFDYAIEQY